MWWANQRCLLQIIVLFEPRGFPKLINMHHNTLLLGIMLRYLGKAFIVLHYTSQQRGLGHKRFMNFHGTTLGCVGFTIISFWAGQGCPMSTSGQGFYFFNFKNKFCDVADVGDRSSIGWFSQIWLQTRYKSRKKRKNRILLYSWAT